LGIDRPILDLLNIDSETPLEITPDGKRLIIERVAESNRAERFQAAQRAAHKRYGRAFKKLAE
jgi:hypothetical protein